MSMNVKGVVYLARKEQVIAAAGEQRWNEFIAEVAAKDAFFGQPIVATTRIPATNFARFVDLLVARFFNGDTQEHWKLGERAAERAFVGPAAGLHLPKDVDGFVLVAPALWRGYYDAGALSATLGADVVTVHVTDVPVHHVFFEFSVLGYVQRGLELVTGRAYAARRVRGFTLGHTDVLYEFEPAGRESTPGT